MNVQILVFTSQKGGSGKTTLSGHVAVAAQAAGAGPVALIDADPQGSLANWWNARESETPAFAHVSVRDLGRDIDALKDAGFKLIVIDTPPAVTGSISEIVTFADLVVIPTRPSPHDLRAVGATVDIVELQRKPLVFVVNGATARARITGETAVALSQHGTVAPVTLHHRVDFAASMIDGRTVGEVNPSSRSAKEVAALWEYLADKLTRLRAPQADAPGAPRPTFENDIFSGVSSEAPRSAHRAGENADLDMLEEADEAAAPWESRPPAPAAPWPGERPARILSATAGGPADDLVADDWPEHADLGSADMGWDGIERRKANLGPPPELPERRGHPVFGRRGNE